MYMTHSLLCAHEGEPAFLSETGRVGGETASKDVLDICAALEQLDESLEGFEVEVVVRCRRGLWGRVFSLCTSVRSGECQRCIP